MNTFVLCRAMAKRAVAKAPGDCFNNLAKELSLSESRSDLMS